MRVWEFKNGSQNDVAMLVYANDAEIDAGIFDAKGDPLSWDIRPHTEVFIEPGKKKSKPRVDISALRPGTLVLNAKARAALGDFLAQFGQLLEIDVQGSIEWFYNVTNVIDCIDADKSDKRPSGAIAKEAFQGMMPSTPALFKDPRTARTKIYANEGAKAVLESLMAAAHLTGAVFSQSRASVASFQAVDLKPKTVDFVRSGRSRPSAPWRPCWPSSNQG
jgi:hypothetical protein